MRPDNEKEEKQGEEYITLEELQNFRKKLEEAIEILDRMVTYLFAYRDNPVF